VRPNAAGKAFRASPAGFRGGMDASACRHFGEAKGGLQVVTFQELDERVPFAQQLGAGEGPIVFMNTFHVAPEEVDEFMQAWRVDGEFMQRQPGYVSTQLHRGIAGSTTFVNVAVWDSVESMRNAVSPGVPVQPGQLPADLGRLPAHLHEGRRPGNLRCLSDGAPTSPDRVTGGGC